jgi:HTH-type transcriptional repressor of NAD biosynthesis genes
MKRGLIIGKFMPVHAGHLDLINFGFSRCDELIVSMSYKDDDPIDPLIRFGWLTEIFKNVSGITLGMIKNDFDNESLTLDGRTKIWADVIRKNYPDINVVFSSEPYGEPFALNLNAAHVAYDAHRGNKPVSATRIRKNPFKHWEYIPSVVRPYFVKKFCFYGPESTGKSTMAKRMAELYQTEFVPEVAREMLINNVFSVGEIIAIGKAQTQRVIENSQKANRVLFCDTDLITTQIYSNHYLDTIPPILFDLEKIIHYDHYFLFDIDVPWIADGLRDLPHLREKMYNIFKSELDKRKIPYTNVQGTPSQREEIIITSLRELLSQE